MASTIFELYIYGIIYYFLWLNAMQSGSRKQHLNLVLFSNLALFILGVYLFYSNSYTEVTPFGSGILKASAIVILSPTLYYLKDKPISTLKSVLTLVFLPAAGFTLNLVCLALSHQIWI